MIRSKAYSMTDEEFINIIKDSTSCADAMRKMGYKCTNGGSHSAIKRRIQELNIDTTHWGNQTKNAHLASKIPDEQFYVSGINRGRNLKLRVLKDKKIPYICACCGNTGTWNGRELVLQLDHINGDHLDNRLDNLRFLCPNCHSQTDTFAGKNCSLKDE